MSSYGDHSDSSSGDEQEPEAPKLPEKNYCLFSMDECVGTIFPRDIFKGVMGELPILMAVNVGYDPEDYDPYMYHYESQEVMFAFRSDSQKRVLIHDSHNRTLSLPLNSPVKFTTRETGKKEVTVSEIVSSQSLPVPMEFSKPECMDFIVDKHTKDHSFFGSLVLISVYEELFYWCLSIDATGRIRDKPCVLPKNLRDVCFSPVNSVKGASDPKAKLQELIETKYLKYAQQLHYDQDPFFQELAIVSRGPDPLMEIRKPYIQNTTFVDIQYHRRPAPLAPQGEAPVVPPRSPHTQHTEAAKPQKKVKAPKKISTSSPSASSLVTSSLPAHDDVTGAHPGYCTLDRPHGDDEHVYSEPTEIPKARRGGPKTQIVKPLHMSAEKADLRTNNPSDSPTLPQRDDPEPEVDKTGSEESDPRCLSMSAPPPPELPPRTRPGKIDLKELSINDVSAKLKQLSLDKYVKPFRKACIDGVLLQKLSEETLKSEFKMTQLDFLRLHTFVTEGHIPVKRSSSESEKDSSKFGTLRKFMPSL